MDLVIWSASLFLSINAVGYNLIYSYNHFNINWSPIDIIYFLVVVWKLIVLKVIYRKSSKKHCPMINVLNVINLLWLLWYKVENIVEKGLLPAGSCFDF